MDDPWRRLIATRLSVRETCRDLALLLVTVATVITVWFQPWNNSPRIPIRYVNDGLFYSMNIQTIIETGWVQSNDRLGAPFGQELYDFPVGADNGNYLIIKVLTWFTSDFGLVLNLFYLGGFLTVAAATYVCARMLGTSRLMALTVGVLYTFAPFHFLRAGHVMLAHYAVVPIGVVLAVRVATGRSFGIGDRRAVSIAGWGFACIALGSFGAYYAIFALLSIVLMAVISAAANRSTRPLTAAAGFGAVIGTVLVANLASSLLYRRSNGINDVAGVREAIEFDLNAFRLIQALTPPPGSRLPFVGDRGGILDDGILSEPTMYFGVIASLCLLTMFVWLGRAVITAGLEAPRTSEGSHQTAVLRRLLAVSTLGWVLLATAGGFNWIFLLVGFDRIRGWGRASIVMLFMVLVWGALSATRLAERRAIPHSVLAGVLGAVCIVGVADQITDNPIPGQFDGDYLEDQALFTRVQSELPSASSVAQLPYIPFPETALNDSRLYDPVRPFLHTTDITFSYGGMRGRETDWQEGLATMTTAEQVDAFLALGFDALIAHRPAFVDRGAQLIADLDTIAAESVVLTERGSWIYVPLDPAMTDLTTSELFELRLELVGADAATNIEEAAQ